MIQLATVVENEQDSVLSLTSCTGTNCKPVAEISWNLVCPFLFTHACKHAHSRLAKCLYYYSFLCVFSSHSVGMGSQPMGIDGKHDRTVVACIKDVSVCSLYQRLHFLNCHSMVSQFF